MATAQILIHRRRRKDTTVDNSIIWDRSLSNMARFTLIAILSLPEDWDYSVRGMATMLGVSKDTMGKYLRELETARYLRRQQGGDKGKFSKSIYTITDTPGEFGDEEPPCPKKYDRDCPDFSAPKKSPQQNVKVLCNNLPPIAPQGGQDAAVYSFPLKDGTSYGVTAREVDYWRSMFPTVDVDQQLRSMASWLETNPQRRKTGIGITRFIRSWLSKEAERVNARMSCSTSGGGGRWNYEDRQLI